MEYFWFEVQWNIHQIYKLYQIYNAKYLTNVSQTWSILYDQTTGESDFDGGNSATSFLENSDLLDQFLTLSIYK